MFVGAAATVTDVVSSYIFIKHFAQTSIYQLCLNANRNMATMAGIC